MNLNVTIIGVREAGFHGIVAINGGHMDVMIPREPKIDLKVGETYSMDLFAMPRSLSKVELDVMFFPGKIVKQAGRHHFIIEVDVMTQNILCLDRNTIMCHHSNWCYTLQTMVEDKAPLIGQNVEFQLSEYNGVRCAGYTKPIVQEHELLGRALDLEIWAEQLNLERIGEIRYCDGGMRMILRWRYGQTNPLYEVTVIVYPQSNIDVLRQYIRKEYDEITAQYAQF